MPKPNDRLQVHGRLVSHCTGDKNYYPGEPRKRCDGVYWEDGKFTGGCNDPCSFVMRKGGSGDPDFLTAEGFMKELNFLLARCGRWNDANRT